jgi:hypothetical protein
VADQLDAAVQYAIEWIKQQFTNVPEQFFAPADLLPAGWAELHQHHVGARLSAFG